MNTITIDLKNTKPVLSVYPLGFTYMNRVYFRKENTPIINPYTNMRDDEAEHAAYKNETISLLESLGWKWYGKSEELRKGDAVLTISTHFISGFSDEVLELSAVFKEAKTFRVWETDIRPDLVPIVKDDADELRFYHAAFDGLMHDVLFKRFATKRCNLYKNLGAAQWSVVESIHIPTNIHLYGICGDYPVAKYVDEWVKKYIDCGYIKVGVENQKLARFATKKECPGLYRA